MLPAIEASGTTHLPFSFPCRMSLMWCKRKRCYLRSYVCAVSSLSRVIDCHMFRSVNCICHVPLTTRCERRRSCRHCRNTRARIDFCSHPNPQPCMRSCVWPFDSLLTLLQQVRCDRTHVATNWHSFSRIVDFCTRRYLVFDPVSCMHAWLITNWGQVWPLQWCWRSEECRA